MAESQLDSKVASMNLGNEVQQEAGAVLKPDAAMHDDATQVAKPVPKLEPPKEWPEKLKLELMPEEILLEVLDWIPRQTDLKSLCLASTQMRRLATPRLYRCMHLYVGGPQDKRLSAFLRPSNPGIQHVREIFMRLEKVPDASRSRRHSWSEDTSDEDEERTNTAFPAKQAQFTVRLLLDHLPRNQLESFSWQNWEPLDTENFELLCATQKNLRSIEFGPMDEDLEPRLAKKPDLFNHFPKLKSVDVYPNSIDQLHAANRLLQAKPEIEQLTVSTGFEYTDSGAPAGLEDTSTSPGLLTSTLFKHMRPFDSCQPFRNLKSLDLDTVDVRYCADTWCKVIKFSNLKKLEIRNCPGAEMLWAQASKPHQRPTQLTSLRWMDDSKCTQPALDAFDNFLECITGLEILHVFVVHMDRLPNVGSIVAHKKTLESLSVHSAHDKHTPYTYDENEFERLCVACEGLRQLSINFPKTTADGPSLSDEFSAFVYATWSLRHLRTLNIRRWPTSRDGFCGMTVARVLPSLRLYESHLQRLAQQLFEKSDSEAKERGDGHGHRSNLSVVAWGGNGRSRHDRDDKYKLRQIPFVRGTQINAFGKRSMLAVQTIWRLIQFIEPESDILNHSLYDMHEVSDLSQIHEEAAL